MSQRNPAPAEAGARATSAFVEVTPNPARLLSSLRDSGIPNHAAIAGIVDNSIDADSSSIHIFVEPKIGTLRVDNTRLVISDNGGGMDFDTLSEALKLGSNTGHDPVSDLGKFGMGLITDSTSMAKRLTIYTKEPEGKLLIGIHDLDTIYEKNQFLAEIRAASKADATVWDQYAVDREHGTMVVLDKCDQLNYANAGALINRLKKHLGQVFRQFITAKSHKNGKFLSFISINGDPIYAVDPLMLEENKDYIFPGTRDLIPDYATLIDDFTIDVDIDPSDVARGRDQIRVRVVDLPDAAQALAGELGITVSNQGIYVMRNQREIAPAQTLTIFSRAQNLNRFRAELHIPASLDRRVGIDWTKDRIVPDQGIQEVLKQRIGPHVRTLRKTYDRKASSALAVDHKPFESLIARKAKLLSLPKAKKIERTLDPRHRGSVIPKGTDIQREGQSDVPQRIRDRCEFKESAMSVAGPLWDVDTRGQKILITFNSDHPLWVRFVLNNQTGDADDKSVLELLHLMSYCLSAAELSVFGDEDMLERLINMRQQLSSNMRVLLT
jgi:hypothetical protein